jgi:hypothetical protein
MPGQAQVFLVAFIFLNLLKGYVELGTKLFLTHSQKRSPQPDPPPDMLVDGVIVGNAKIAFGWRFCRHDTTSVSRSDGYSEKLRAMSQGTAC